MTNLCRIRKWCLLDRDYSVKTGEMTPTMKMVRGKILHIYKDQIDGMYIE